MYTQAFHAIALLKIFCPVYLPDTTYPTHHILLYLITGIISEDYKLWSILSCLLLHPVTRRSWRHCHVGAIATHDTNSPTIALTVLVQRRTPLYPNPLARQPAFTWTSFGNSCDSRDSIKGRPVFVHGGTGIMKGYRQPFSQTVPTIRADSVSFQQNNVFLLPPVSGTTDHWLRECCFCAFLLYN